MTYRWFCTNTILSIFWVFLSSRIKELFILLCLEIKMMKMMKEANIYVVTSLLVHWEDSWG